MRNPAELDRAIDRERCRRSLSAYVRLAWPVLEPGTTYLHNWHIDAIAEYLEAVTAGELTRLVINMPPRYMKSLMVSILWPTWEWTLNPEMRWVFASYSGSLSLKHSGDRRALIQSGWYQDRWGETVRLSKDSKAKEEFTNERRGHMIATSVGGTSTGKGGDRVIVDDPHNPTQAASDTMREAGVKFFNETLYSRLDDKKRGAIVCVMQRLHEEDLSGRLLELGYEHLKLPGEAKGRTVVTFPWSGREVVREDGDLLWPEREGPKEIAAVKATLGSYGYAGQYDQDPSPAGGGILKSVWFQPVDAAPASCPSIRYWDKAGTQGGGAFTAGVLMTRRPDGVYFVVDVVRGQWGAKEREDKIKQTAEADGKNVAVWLEQEPGSGGKESAQNTVINLAGWNVHAETVSGDKVERARPVAAQAEAGNLRIVRDTPAKRWTQAFLDECDGFPTGKYKDQVDALSGAFNKLALVDRPGASAVAGQRGTLATAKHPSGIVSVTLPKGLH